MDFVQVYSAVDNRVMRNEPLDFIGVDYGIDNREVEATILPLAQERKVGVLVYALFGRTVLEPLASEIPCAGKTRRAMRGRGRVSS
jgi:aryl-alcohol dehydrogenase-like predicted oxidoreductase